MKPKISWFWFFVSGLQLVAFVLGLIMALRAGLPGWVPFLFLVNFLMICSNSILPSDKEKD